MDEHGTNWDAAHQIFMNNISEGKTMTTTPKDDLPEARILPRYYSVKHNWEETSIYDDSNGSRLCTMSLSDHDVTEDNQDELEKMQAEQAKMIVDALNRTPAIADGSDLFICRRTVAGDDSDGATRYYVYHELRPYDGAIADGVEVEPPKDGTAFYGTFETPMRWKAYKPEARKQGYPEGRWQEMNEYGGWENTDRVPVKWRPHESTPPQAATDEG